MYGTNSIHSVAKIAPTDVNFLPMLTRIPNYTIGFSKKRLGARSHEACRENAESWGCIIKTLRTSHNFTK
jgi:hypothetical protein